MPTWLEADASSSGLAHPVVFYLSHQAVLKRVKRAGTYSLLGMPVMSPEEAGQGGRGLLMSALRAQGAPG